MGTCYGMDAAFSPVNHLGIRGGYRGLSNYDELSSTGGSGQTQVFNGSDWQIGVGRYSFIRPDIYGVIYTGVGLGSLRRRGSERQQKGSPIFNRDEDFDADYQYAWIEPSLVQLTGPKLRMAMGFRYSLRRFTRLYRPYQNSSENSWESDRPYRLDAFFSFTHLLSRSLFLQTRVSLGTGNMSNGARQGRELSLDFGLALGFQLKN